jgi:hypothetical protein
VAVVEEAVALLVVAVVAAQVPLLVQEVGVIAGIV